MTSATGTCRGNRSRRHGYTLLEIVLVSTLLVILVAMAWPAINAWNDVAALRRYRDQCSGLLQGLRLRAMEAGQPYVLRFVPGGGDYEVVHEADTAMVTQKPVVDDPSGAQERVEFDEASLLGTHQLDEGLSFAIDEAAWGNTGNVGESEGLVELRFYPDGRVSSISFDITDPSESCFSITMVGLTGEVLLGDVESNAVEER